MIHKITEIIERPQRDCIYDLIGYFHLGLCVDIGAAAGHTTKRICLAGGADTKVVAFEPFPGNYQFFYEYTKGLGNVALIKKAVGRDVGMAEFIVPAVVQGTEPGWETYTGYSSLGYLSSGVNDPFSKIKQYLRRMIRWTSNWTHKRAAPQKLRVHTTSIDAEFSGKKIDFVKIDVQGGERDVLLGADAMLRRKMINVLYIEWSGDPDVVQILENYGYRIYDSTYIAVPTAHNLEQFEQIGFQFLEEVKLSTGEIAYELLLTNKEISPGEAIRMVGKKRLGFIQTDLIAVSEDVLGRFIEAAKQYSKTEASAQL